MPISFFISYIHTNYIKWEMSEIPGNQSDTTIPVITKVFE